MKNLIEQEHELEIRFGRTASQRAQYYPISNYSDIVDSSFVGHRYAIVIDDNALAVHRTKWKESVIWIDDIFVSTF